MNVHMTGHHIEVTPAIRSYLEEKLQRVKRHFDQAMEVHATFSVEKHHQKAALTLHVRGQDFHAEDIEKSLYAAIDLVVDKLDKQVLKYKTKHLDPQHDLTKRQDLAS